MKLIWITLLCISLSAAASSEADREMAADQLDPAGTAKPAFEPMSSDELASLPNPEPSHRIAYGKSELQYGELFLPAGQGPFPTVILIHGGCWLAQYDLAHIRSLAAALAENGLAVWSIEYRRVGDENGGWPHTFGDVADAADSLRSLAEQYPLDLSRTLAMGHSAGGQLALWLAGRPKLTADSEIYRPNPLPIAGVLAMAPAPDLPALHEAGVCGNVIDGLVGGSPAQFPNRYAQATPAALLPLGVRQTVLLGVHDTFWSPGGESYWRAAQAAGDAVAKVSAPESGHFEMIVPTSTTWPLVLKAAQELLTN